MKRWKQGRFAQLVESGRTGPSLNRPNREITVFSFRLEASQSDRSAFFHFRPYIKDLIFAIDRKELIVTKPSRHVGLCHANPQLVPAVLFERPDAVGFIAGCIDTVDAGEAHQRSAPSAQHNAKPLVTSGQRESAEEVESV